MQKEKIKSKMQILYRKMERFGMKPIRSEVYYELIDPYNNSTETGYGTIASMIVMAEDELQKPIKALDGKPDQIVFNVEDKKGNGSGSLIYNLDGSYIGIQVFDSQFNEIG